MNERPSTSLAVVRASQDDATAVIARLGGLCDLDLQRFTQFARKAISDNPELAECSRPSLRRALANCAVAGLMPNGKEATILVFRSKGGGKTAQFIPGYRGLAMLAWEHPDISRVHAAVVYRGDVFEIHQGTDPRLLHQPNPEGDAAAGDIIGAYAVASVKGETLFEYLPRRELDAIVARSPGGGKTGPWTTDFGEMAKKTAFKRLAKWLPASRRMAAAIAADTAAEIGISAGVEPEIDEIVDATPEPGPELKPWKGGDNVA